MSRATDSTFISLVFLLCALSRAFGSAVINGPSSVLVGPGEWATFTCSVDCSRDIDWFVEGYASDISDTCIDNGQDMMACMEEVEGCSTTDSPTMRTHRLRLMAMNELPQSVLAVQCGGVLKVFNFDTTPDPYNPYIVYSRFAFLTVSSPETPVPTTTTVGVSPSPVTVTETERLTVAPSPVVVTSTVVVTVNGPDCTTGALEPTPLASSISGERRLHLSSLLRELVTWLLTLFTGLVFL